MKIKKIFPILLASIFLIKVSVYAENKVYILGDHEYGIVADSDEWVCNGYGSCITGYSKVWPIFFTFTTNSIWDPMSYNNIDPRTGKTKELNPQSAMKFAKDYLLNNAKQSNCIFSNVTLKENTKFIVSGQYLDNHDSGEFLIYMKTIPAQSYCYLMFIKLKERLMVCELDEEARNQIYLDAFNLITPLYSTK